MQPPRPDTHNPTRASKAISAGLVLAFRAGTNALGWNGGVAGLYVGGGSGVLDHAGGGVGV